MATKDMHSDSEAYERFMGRWSRLLGPELVRYVGVRDGAPVLDVGCGTGALTVAVVRAAPATEITGVEVSAAYIRRARTLASERVRFEVGDACKLRLANGTFDYVLSMLVMNFIPDRDRALGEMIRVARPGGTIAAAVWDYGDGMEMLRAFWDEAVALNASAEPFDERHMPLCKKGELARLWRRAGLLGVEEQPLSITLKFSSFDDYWRPFLGGQGPAGSYLASRPAAERGLLEQRLRRRLLGSGGDRPISMRARAWAVKGSLRPGDVDGPLVGVVPSE